MLAADLDSGENAVLTYKIASGNQMGHFEIDPSQGIISVAAEIDRETVILQRVWYYALCIYDRVNLKDCFQDRV